MKPNVKSEIRRPKSEGRTKWPRALAQFVIRHSSFVISLLSLLLATGGSRAAETPQPGRFLLIFETSPVLKNNLPAIRQTLGKLFASNLQNEIQNDDDLAVWTVDQSLHTGSFPLASWSPGDAAMYAERLNDFLEQQKFTRHASLANVQPLLNRVAKNSERLTVLIFCDNKSRLLGTPYDSGVNEIITNAAARLKGAPTPFILVLRSYHGEYLGCSVNRSGTLSFPKFPPPPPPPAAPPVIKPAVVSAPVPPPPPRPMVTPVPSLIIVGTNTSTNIPAVTAPAATPAPAPPPAAMANPQASNPTPTNAAIPVPPAPAPKVVAAPPANPGPVPAPPAPANRLPVPATTLQKTSPPEPVVAVSPPATVRPANPAVVSPSNTLPSVAENQPAGADSLRPWALGGGAVVVAGLAIWLITRARRPRASLITSSMQDDLRRPPRK